MGPAGGRARVRRRVVRCGIRRTKSRHTEGTRMLGRLRVHPIHPMPAQSPPRTAALPVPAQEPRARVRVAHPVTSARPAGAKVAAAPAPLEAGILLARQALQAQRHGPRPGAAERRQAAGLVAPLVGVRRLPLHVQLAVFEHELLPAELVFTPCEAVEVALQGGPGGQQVPGQVRGSRASLQSPGAWFARHCGARRMRAAPRRGTPATPA
mmetsp:Transcript_8587/g.24113  ORF Transcript_8587/g.24113 Transcript_8587/m.24113 type:complete len:210 (-) Transcript_8587:2-631(-)